MQLIINNMLYALSTALDFVEAQLVGATTYYAKRVAYIAVKMACELGLTPQEQLNLAAAAVLHDNALTEYIQSEYIQGINVLEERDKITLKTHCEMGERNVKALPFYKEIQGAILYHHEHADGTGPCGMRTEETPLYGRLIHLADQVDVRFSLGTMTTKKYEKIQEYLSTNVNTLFDKEIVEVFHKALPIESMYLLEGEESTINLKKTCQSLLKIIVEKSYVDLPPYLLR